VVGIGGIRGAWSLPWAATGPVWLVALSCAMDPSEVAAVLTGHSPHVMHDGAPRQYGGFVRKAADPGPPFDFHVRWLRLVGGPHLAPSTLSPPNGRLPIRSLCRFSPIRALTNRTGSRINMLCPAPL
jgi:hypothetical protein